jgi:hypothetical protein
MERALSMRTTRFRDSVSRRSVVAGIGAGGLGVAAAMTGQVSAQESTPGTMGTHPVVGTWIVRFEDPTQAPAVGVWLADGSFLDAGSGHAGRWEPTGPNTALHSWIHIFPEDNNYVVVSGTIKVDASGDNFTQPYSAMVVSADGTVLNTISSEVNATRFRTIPEDQLGTPLDIVPAWGPESATPET